MISRLKLTLLSLVFTFSLPLAAGEVNVAVASNFISPMQQLVERFEAQTGHQVRVSYGSSGKLYSQILRGAPFALFLSADQDKIQRLQSRGLIVEDSRYTYALGRMLIWAPKWPETIDVPQALQAAENIRIAIANPRLAPYGKAAEQVLERLHLAQNEKVTLVQGENIAQAFQFVHTGNANLGVIALSQWQALKQSTPGHASGSAWIIPATWHSPIKQDLALLDSGNQAASAFAAFLKTPQAHTIIRSFGYETVVD